MKELNISHKMMMKTAKIDYKNIYFPPGGILLWTIVFLELFTFGLALVALVFYSKEDPKLYHNSRLMLNPAYGAVNTVFLLVSGFFMAVSVHYFKLGAVKRSSFYLRLTMLGGFLFLMFKGFEYYDKIEHGLTLGYNQFFNFYWLLTGFHVIHVVVGLVILMSVYRGMNKQNSTSEIEDVEASATFWHMCDLIWLLLFPVLYLLF